MNFKKKLKVDKLLVIETEDNFRSALVLKKKLSRGAPCLVDINGANSQLVGAVQRASFHYVAYCYVNGVWLNIVI